MKPSSEQMQHALEVAESMRERDDDPEYLSRTLLYMQHRLEVLERVCDVANEYMRFGQDEREHAKLLQALKAAREVEYRESSKEREDFGL